MARYSPGTVPTSPQLDQTQRWLREEFEGVRGSTDDTYSLADFIADNYVIAGYGSVSRGAPIALANIGSSWQDLTWDGTAIPDPKGVAYNLPEGYTLEQPGVWNQNIMITLAFNDANAGRKLQLRIRNTTDGDNSDLLDFFVGRNQDGMTLTVGVLVQVTDEPGEFTFQQMQISKDVKLQIRSEEDTFTGVSFDHGAWGISHASEYKGTFYSELTNADRRRSL